LSAPRHLPVHRERIGEPIGLNDACQGGDTVLRAVKGSGRKQVPPRLGAEEIAQVEGDNAVSEIRNRYSRNLGVTVERPYGNAAEVGAAVPLDFERAG